MGAAPILKILKDGEEIKAVAVEGEALLGRSEGCAIQLADRAISRQHAVFRATAEGVQVERKSEFAPLSVNGAECTRAILKSGDVVSIGPYLVKLAGGAAESQPMAKGPQPAPVESISAPMPEIDAITAEPESSSAEPMAELAPLELSSPSMEEQPSELAMEGGGIPDLQISLDGSGDGSGSSAESGAPEVVSIDPAAFDDEAGTKVAANLQISAKLILSEGAANVTELDLSKPETTIGRGKECDIVLTDRKSSRKHAVIKRVGASFVLVDQGSANATRVNGEKVTDYELSADDVIQIGDTEIRFVATHADYEAQAGNFLQVVEEPVEPEPDPAPMDAPMAGGGMDMMASGDAGAQPFEGVPGIGGATIPGMDSGKKQTLLEKFRALPKQKQMIYGAVILVGLWFLLDDGPETQVDKKKDQPVATASPGKGPLAFESLNAEQKKFVQTQHALAFDLYKNREYDKTLFEVRKIFQLIPDYKDAREIERYAAEGKRKMEAMEEEKRQKAEAEKIRARILELVGQVGELMKKKNYDGARELFPEVLAIDPDNAQIAAWQKEIVEWEEKKQIEEQAKRVQSEINKRTWEVYNEGVALKDSGKYFEAIDVFSKVGDLGSTDKRPVKKAAQGIEDCKAAIAAARDPVLAEAKQKEESGELAEAFKLYLKASQIDHTDQNGPAGMERIRKVLHNRSKDLYTEAVLAESFSDFGTARKKYSEILATAPEDDIYHERARRKLSRFLKEEQM